MSRPYHQKVAKVAAALVASNYYLAFLTDTSAASSNEVDQKSSYFVSAKTVTQDLQRTEFYLALQQALQLQQFE